MEPQAATIQEKISALVTALLGHESTLNQAFHPHEVAEMINTGHKTRSASSSINQDHLLHACNDKTLRKSVKNFIALVVTFKQQNTWVGKQRLKYYSISFSSDKEVILQSLGAVAGNKQGLMDRTPAQIKEAFEEIVAAEYDRKVNPNSQEVYSSSPSFSSSGHLSSGDVVQGTVPMGVQQQHASLEVAVGRTSDHSAASAISALTSSTSSSSSDTAARCLASTCDACEGGHSPVKKAAWSENQSAMIYDERDISDMSNVESLLGSCDDIPTLNTQIKRLTSELSYTKRLLQRPCCKCDYFVGASPRSSSDSGTNNNSSSNSSSSSSSERMVQGFTADVAKEAEAEAEEEEDEKEEEEEEEAEAQLVEDHDEEEQGDEDDSCSDSDSDDEEDVPPEVIAHEKEVCRRFIELIEFAGALTTRRKNDD